MMTLARGSQPRMNRNRSSRPTRRGPLRGIVFSILVAAIVTGCTGGLFTPSARTESPVTVRLENATASTINVLVEVLDSSGAPLDETTSSAVDIPVITIDDSGVTYGVLTPIGASAASAAGGFDSDLAVNADVRVPGYSVSTGELLCDSMVRITATIDDEDETPIRLGGEGSGTPAFDQGSVGETGERYLRIGTDTACGEQIVVRIGEDPSGNTSSNSGTVAVTASGVDSPFDPVVNPGSGDNDDNDDTPASTQVTVQVENQGSVIGTLRLELTTNDGGTQDYEVTVPPSAVTEGTFSCGTQMKFTATYPDPETPEDQETERIVVLSGAGTGSLGFDDQSVARNGERYLVVGSDVSCGDTVRVSIRDDVEAIGFQGIGVFSGTVTVIEGD